MRVVEGNGMTWHFPHRMLACYSLLPVANHISPPPRLLEACSKEEFPLCGHIARERNYRLTICDIEPIGPCVDKQDITALSYKAGTFTGIISSDTLEHVEDMDAALAELRRVTADGGFLILCLPVCFLGDGRKRQTTERAEAGDVNHHLWRPGMDMEQRACAVGYRVVARVECFDFRRMHLSALWLLECE